MARNNHSTQMINEQRRRSANWIPNPQQHDRQAARRRRPRVEDIVQVDIQRAEPAPGTNNWWDSVDTNGLRDALRMVQETVYMPAGRYTEAIRFDEGETVQFRTDQMRVSVGGQEVQGLHGYYGGARMHSPGDPPQMTQWYHSLPQQEVATRQRMADWSASTGRDFEWMEPYRQMGEEYMACARRISAELRQYLSTMSPETIIDDPFASYNNIRRSRINWDLPSYGEAFGRSGPDGPEGIEIMSYEEDFDDDEDEQIEEREERTVPRWIRTIAGAFTPPEQGFRMQVSQIEEYLGQLCNQTGRSYDAINIDWYRDCEDRNDINKVFFSQEAPAIQTTIPTDDESKINLLFSSTGPAQKLMQELNSEQAEMAEYSEHLNRAMGKVSSLQVAIELLRKAPLPNIAENVKNVLNKGQWKLHQVAHDHISFDMVNPVILRWKDDEKGVDITCNMGKFRLAYFPANSTIKVLASGDNIKSGGYYHPHVSGSDGVCWGNAKETINQALKTQDVGAILGTTFLLLNEYNSGSPYRILSEFVVDRDYTSTGANLRWIFEAHYKKHRLGGSRDSTTISSPDGKNYRMCKVQVWTRRSDKLQFVRDQFLNMVPLDESWIFHETDNKKTIYP